MGRFEPEVASGGLIIFNSSLIDTTPTRSDVELVAIPATEIADELGSVYATNMVVLGAFLGRSHLFPPRLVFTVLEAFSRDRHQRNLNVRAIRAGMRFTQLEV